MSLIAFYTAAYNAEHTIARCIESVLAQTHRDFIYYIIDDASTDGTWRIIQNYAQQDARIRAIRNEKNIYPRGYSKAFPIICESAAEWFSMVDNDDWIEPAFAEHLLSLTEKSDVDAAICGTKFETAGGEQVPPRAINVPTMLLEQTDIMGIFPHLHVLFRTLWAKLLRVSVLRQICDSIPAMGYGLDTVVMFRFLAHCKRIVMTNELLHHWFSSGTSASYRYDPDRLQDVIDTDEATQAYLRACGGDTQGNQAFLALVNINAVWETIMIAARRMFDTGDKTASPLALLNHSFLKHAWDIAERDTSEGMRQQLMQWRERMLYYVLQPYKPGHEAEVWGVVCWISPHMEEFWGAEQLYALFHEMRLAKAVLFGTPEKALAYASLVEQNAFTASVRAYFGDVACAQEYGQRYASNVTPKQRRFLAQRRQAQRL